MYIGQAEMAVTELHEQTGPGKIVHLEKMFAVQTWQSPNPQKPCKIQIQSVFWPAQQVLTAQTCSHTQGCTYFFKVTDCGSKKKDRQSDDVNKGWVTSRTCGVLNAASHHPASHNPNPNFCPHQRHHSIEKCSWRMLFSKQVFRNKNLNSNSYLGKRCK